MLTRVIDWLLDPIGGWAGRRWGLFDTISTLEKEVAILQNDVQARDITIKGMHAHYMAEYRRLESEAADLMRSFDMQAPLTLTRKKLLGAQNLTIVTHTPELVMANTDYQEDKTSDFMNMRVVERTMVQFAFALEPKQKRDELKRAMALATKASQLVYDAVMTDCGQRPKRL